MPRPVVMPHATRRHSGKPAQVQPALSAWLGAACISLAAIAGQTATISTARAENVAAAKQAYDIPAGSLSSALSQFAAEAGVMLSADAALAQGKTSKGLQGSYSVEQGFAALLANSGLEASKNASGGYRIDKKTAAAEPALLPEVKVTGGTQETAASHVRGYVAKRSATATKTDTPIIETPQSIAVVTRDQMDAQGAQSVSDALRYTAGVLAEANGPDPRADFIVIRGFDANGRDQYRDGLRTYAFNNQGGTIMEPYGLERIEVLRGPSSILYGQGGAGGLINLVSKRPSATPLHEVQVQLGRYDRKQLAGDFGGALTEDGTWSYRLTGLVRDSDTQIDYVKDDRLFIAPALTWRPSDTTSLTLLTDYQKNRRGQGYQAWPRVGTLDSNPNGRIASSRFLGDPDFDKFDQERSSIGYLFEHAFNQTLTFRQNVRHLQMSSDINTIYQAGLDPVNLRTVGRFGSRGREDIENTVMDNNLQIKFQHGLFEHTALLGLDKQWLKNKSVTSFGVASDIDVYAPVYNTPFALAPDQDTRQRLNQTGMYVQDQIKFDKKWVATLGGRKDLSDQSTTNKLDGTVNKQNDDAFTWRAGLVYLADNGLAPYASYSESFVPVVGTLFGGAPFKPETGQQYELGIRYQPEGSRTSLTFSVFDLARQNVTTADLAHAGFSIQRGEVTSRGFEAEAKTHLSTGLSLIASYTHLDLEITKSNDGNKGNTPSASPKNTASIWADYKLPAHLLPGLNIGGGVRYIGSTYGDEENTFQVTSYALVDAALRYDLSAINAHWLGWKFSVNASNLFDKEYVATCGYYADGCKYGYRRNVMGTLSYTW